MRSLSASFATPTTRFGRPGTELKIVLLVLLYSNNLAAKRADNHLRQYVVSYNEPPRCSSLYLPLSHLPLPLLHLSRRLRATLPHGIPSHKCAHIRTHRPPFSVVISASYLYSSALPTMAEYEGHITAGDSRVRDGMFAVLIGDVKIVQDYN